MLRAKILSVIAVIITGHLALGQDVPSIVREEWESKPVIHKIDAALSAEPAVIISDRRRIEYIDVKDDQVQYRTLHKIIHINDDHGIEAFNKIYLPVVENKSIVDIKARTILPGGKIIELNKNDIKEIKEDDNLYKIFAMEGLTTGCEIEFLYTYNSDLSYFGREIVQGRHLVLRSEVEIVSPDRLRFETRNFNGECSKTDTFLNGKNFVKVALTDLAGTDEEKYSMPTPNLKRVEYKLSYNNARNANERLFTWNDLAKRIHATYSTFNEKETKKVNALANDNGWKKISDEKEKIVAIENYLKKTIIVRNDLYSNDAENIEWILKNKMASEKGMIRLFSSALTMMGVNIEHVLCGSRESFAIDKTFENWLNCNNELIYIPSLKKYLAPTSSGMRFPWIDPTWAGVDGIFCKPTTIGNFTSAIAYTKNITLEATEATQSNIEAHIKFNSSVDTLEVDAKNLFTGYMSEPYRRIFNYNSDEDQKEIMKSMVKHNLGTEKIISSKIENKAFEDYNENKPMIIQTVVQAPDMIEKAGNRVLVKVGELIGPQVEMYQEKKRLFPIEISFPHILARKITMEMPAGYKIRNLDEFKISKVFKENDQVTMGFESTVEVKGNMVTINVFEQYRKIRYSLDQYDPFRDVINAAADFNKLVLVLEKI
jgi:hypothetical protein